MLVDEKQRLKWKLKHQYGDNRKISEISGISEVTICNAKRTGRGSVNTINAINDYYKV